MTDRYPPKIEREAIEPKHAAVKRGINSLPLYTWISTRDNASPALGTKVRFHTKSQEIYTGSVCVLISVEDMRRKENLMFVTYTVIDHKLEAFFVDDVEAWMEIE